MNIPGTDASQYTYDLPEERIARYPLARRDEARLLVWEQGRIHDHIFRELPALLHDDDLLVVNDTKVIRARLLFRRPTGAQIEIFCLEPLRPSSYDEVFATWGPVEWECLVGNNRRWKEEELSAHLEVAGKSVRFSARRLQRLGNTFHIRFSWDDRHLSFGEILDAAGRIPIPPYLKRESEPSDLHDYQTVYARRDGSVAAPTAGLHFTPEMLEHFHRHDRLLEVTLHVGAGTFKPIDTPDIRQHEMHTEHFSVRRPLLERLVRHKGRLIAVGTTSVRTLESLYWLAVQLHREGKDIRQEHLVRQWDPYQDEPSLSPGDAAAFLLEAMDHHHLDELHGATQLMIVPGYRFRYVQGMITNFHMPRSTLLLLIAAFTGEEWRKIYKHALGAGYRFLSYGDASLLLP